MYASQTKIRLRVGGTLFETFEESLLRFPNTILGNPIKRCKFYNEDLGYFEFNRDPHIFDYVLFFYQSNGILAKPSFISDEDFQRELDFFGLLTPCSEESPLMPANRYQQVLWKILEYPDTSRFGRILSHLSVVIAIMSTITLCIESTEEYHNSLTTQDEWFVMETFYVSWFTLEFLARLIGAPNKREFLFSVFGFIDIITILPYIGAITLTADNFIKDPIFFVRTLRLVQILRIFKISRHSKSMRLFGRALMYCKGQMGSMIFFFFVTCLFAASVMHFVERSEGFESIIDSFWFCTITMTTVGYGDVVPVTAIGKIFASFCIVVGILSLFNLFIPVYLSYFSLIYELSTVSLNTSNKTTDSETRPRSASHRSLSITSTISGSARNNSESSRIKNSEEQHINRIRLDYIRRMSVNDSPITKYREEESQAFLPVPKAGALNSEYAKMFPASDTVVVSSAPFTSQLAMGTKRKTSKAFQRLHKNSVDSYHELETPTESEQAHCFEYELNIPLIIVEEF